MCAYIIHTYTQTHTFEPYTISFQVCIHPTYPFLGWNVIADKAAGFPHPTW